jgi:hypothetical protein
LNASLLVIMINGESNKAGCSNIMFNMFKAFTFQIKGGEPEREGMDTY